ncbi:MAG: glycosyltransferase family 2 protein [Lachnospiraceae bacterium]|nr:glycosyltransferase family 2 protein [Lachnospiraceae bacterium]
MIRISLCMIVKNEEAVLARCLDSIADLMDEIIIVDTGSMDKTKEIARRYTNRVYEFPWTGSFSDARNYSFSKASMEYIYCADADEVMDEENRDKFKMLKKGLLPEIDIVQMYYVNQMSYNTVYNFNKELRPKLYKRQRSFVWEGTIHEAVRLEPLVYDSDIEIEHHPTSNHKSRDLAAFEKMYKDHLPFNSRLFHMYAQELYLSGDPGDFIRALPFFAESIEDLSRKPDEIMEACCVCAKACRNKNDYEQFLQYALKAVALGSCSEICCELGRYYDSKNDVTQAAVWYYNAAFETESALSARHHTTLPLSALVDCYTEMEMPEQAARYKELLTEAEKAKE